MNSPKLKIFHPEILSETESENSANKTAAEMILAGVYDPIRVGASDFIRLIHNAVSQQRAWLQDFEDDTMIVSRDFYEVLLAYQQMVEKRAA